jgi:hypothetical protein
MRQELPTRSPHSTFLESITRLRRYTVLFSVTAAKFWGDTPGGIGLPRHGEE